VWSGEGGSGDGVGVPDELGHEEATPAGCDFVPRVEEWFGVSSSCATDGCKCRFGDVVRFGHHRDGVGRGHHVFLSYFIISFEMVKRLN
jgi:hypothetical protein